MARFCFFAPLSLLWGGGGEGPNFILSKIAAINLKGLIPGSDVREEYTFFGK